MATNFMPKSAMPSFLRLAFHNGWQDGKADGHVNSATNFGSLTPDFTMMVWQPFMREIVETRSILGTHIR